MSEKGDNHGSHLRGARIHYSTHPQYSLGMITSSGIQNGIFDGARLVRALGPDLEKEIDRSRGWENFEEPSSSQESKIARPSSFVPNTSPHEVKVRELTREARTVLEYLAQSGMQDGATIQMAINEEHSNGHSIDVPLTLRALKNARLLRIIGNTYAINTKGYSALAIQNGGETRDAVVSSE